MGAPDQLTDPEKHTGSSPASSPCATAGAVKITTSRAAAGPIIP